MAIAGAPEGGGSSSKKSTDNSPWKDWKSNSTKYDPSKDSSGELADKLQSMMYSRIEGGEDIDITEALPNLDEMFTDDLIYSFYKDITDKDENMTDEMASKDKDIQNAIFYSEEPSLKLGYNNDNTFNLELTSINKSDIDKYIALNRVDGDTTTISLDKLSDGGEPFTTVNGVSYNSFKDYCKQNNLDSSELTLRLVGIDAPEIPHTEVIPINTADKNAVVEMTYGEAKKLKNAKLLKYNYSSKDNKASERKDSDPVKLYKSTNGYAEIIKDGSDVLSEEDKALFKDGYTAYVVVSEDNSTLQTIDDGYAAQKNLHNLLKQSKKTILKVDMNAVKANKTSGKYKLYYNHWWNVGKVISDMIDQWHNALEDTTAYTRLSYSPFGTDGYGRFFGEIYCLVDMNGKEVWVNANKYVLAKDPSGAVIANPDFTTSPEMNNIYGSVSQGFELWSYDKNNYEYLDSFNSQTDSNYTKRNELHKKVTGIDFAKFRGCTMFLGDTLMLIPPTSIRNVSGVEYERVPILRGKGSMVKDTSAREQYLEIDLYFYDEYGINGIPYEHTTPNGKKITYYLDGLRSIIAQFKVAPYLPIENEYINDVLGIEAVSLVNLNLRTVEGFPRLIQATLTLRRFNYRIFMPDIPLDYKDKEVNELSEMNPIFAKCFHWETFRYYYQRAIINGNKLKQYAYNTREYFDVYYSNKTTLRPAGFCDTSDEFSLYVPDENWLKACLQVKKDEDYYGQQPMDIELSENCKDFIKKLAAVRSAMVAPKMENFKKYCKLNSIANSFASDKEDNVEKDVLKYNMSIFNSNKPGVNSTVASILEEDLQPFIDKIQESGILKFETVDERYSKANSTITFDLNFHVNASQMTPTETLDLRETLRDVLNLSSVDDILEQNRLTISLKGNVKDGKLDKLTSVSSDKKIIEALAEQLGTFFPEPTEENTPINSGPIDTSAYFTDTGVKEDVFKGYKVIEVDGGDISGTRQANVAVDIGFGDREYWGFTNEHGQLVKVIAKEIIIQDDEKEPVNSSGRYYNDEAKVPGTEAKDMDEGHVIADSLGGVSNAYNITPQNSTLNRSGAQSQLEKLLRDAGGCKNFVAIISYPDSTTQTPSYYNYTYVLNGEKQHTAFSNSDGSTPYDGEEGTKQNETNKIIEEDYDHTNPAAMRFIPYIENVPIQSLASGMSNHFTEMTLKMMDGSAPQYMGASDVSIELRIITEDTMTISMLNVLPDLAMNISKTYRRILSCWPVRIQNPYLQMLGINEVTIDSVQIENLDGYPGVYDIRMRFTSMDRAMRQREQLKKLESKEETVHFSESNIGTFFDIEQSLAYAETYPDLDIPSLSELSSLGYKFIKYKNSEQIYPDPDFYVLYGYEYTAQIIKRNIKEVFLNKIFHCNENGNKASIDSLEEFMYIQDDSGQLISTQFAPSKGLNIARMGGAAEYYTEVIENAANPSALNITKADKKKKGEDKEYDEATVVAGKSLEYLILGDVQEGWELRPGWIATLSPTYTNESVDEYVESNFSTSMSEDKDDKYAELIFNRRKTAIECIDAILAEPISDVKNITSVDPRWYKEDPFHEAVQKVFKKNENGQLLAQLLCPIGDTKDLTNFKWAKHSEYAGKLEKGKALDWIQHFLHAAACTLSGEGYKTNNGVYEDYGARQYYDSKGTPYCLCESSGKSATQAKSVDDAIKNGIQFGMCQIRKESKASILKRIQPDSKIDYLGGGKTHSVYKNMKDGFLDPYYNKLKDGNSELDSYIDGITKNAAYNAVAFLRVVLMYLRKQIIDGYHISEIDIIGSDSDELNATFSDTDKTLSEIYQGWKDLDENGLPGFLETLKSQYQVKDFNGDGEKSIWDYGASILGWATNPLQNVINGGKANYTYFKNIMKSTDINEIEDKTDGELDGKAMVALRDSVNEKFKKSYCARWVYPFLEAATQTAKGPSDTVINYIYNRKFDELNALSSSLLSASCTSSELITKFLLITGGSLTNIDTGNLSESTTSDAQKIMNSIMKEAYTGLSEDPQAYVLHSFYDMLVNDKRGRLIRAFPTYYVVFIDEGRKIGSWKLFDNFYNMSAISELTVTKSRKIAADTCSFVMSNIFSSYASEYDNTTRENYVNNYNIKDVFTSVFSPTSYVKKEDALRRRKKSLETTVLRPGVRLHIRMGYGSNAGRLPVVFNGRIAEVDVGDVVTIVGQGDGSELMNPLNALGDVDATNLIEAQSFTTICKDLRGALARGGLSPRNLLAQLLTARHGGLWKSGIREIFDERWYGDNPFGIYHFGDRRFNQIFTDGEPVQNLFEVVDGTLLSGANELYPSKETTIATPTLNTNLQDKTFWDVLTMAAYSGVGYIGAVRDFGFRSTVCLCKRNHYYAYNYHLVDGKYVEKRKPFQQFHYYDSYTDIIYNSIKATDKTIKTNAVGVWEGTDVFWGQEQKTCGPVYLDINIYPEYQKSMTVDTGLIAKGNGGIDIPFSTHYSEEWNMNADADKVNKSLAERITINALRESLQGMYAGEICVVGDPSVKPYDRFYLTDVYEDMTGQLEVEAVVYSMNFNTGFTTTIYPDLIVRQDDPLEPVVHNITGNVVASFIATITARLGIIQAMASVESKMVTVAAKVIKGTFTTLSSAQAAQMFGKTALGRFFSSSATAASTTATGFKGILETLGLTGGNLYVIAAIIIIAVTTYILTKNAKSFISRWVRNIQVLDIYPIFKNQRPYIAGINGHKGCVVGYNYTEEDAADSVQGMIVKCVEKIDNFPFGTQLLNVFMERDVYNQAVFNWSNTLTTLGTGFDEPNKLQAEVIAQEALNSVSKDYAGRSAATAMVSTKYRIQSFNTNGGQDKTYRHYRNLGVILSKDVKAAKIKGTSVTTSSFYTNKNILSLMPVEDDPDIKKAIEKSHGNIKSFSLLHSKGNKRDGLTFESGYRVIRYIIEDNPSGTYSNFKIMDLPMIQEDAMYVLKFIINDEHLKDKKITFLSGARINDTRSWKNTGFAFDIQCNDKEALAKAVEAVKKNTFYNIGKKQVPLFNYKMNGDICSITVYAEKVNEVDKSEK